MLTRSMFHLENGPKLFDWLEPQPITGSSRIIGHLWAVVKRVLTRTDELSRSGTPSTLRVPTRVLIREPFFSWFTSRA